MNKSLTLLFCVVCLASVSLLSGCVRTGTLEPEKWAPKERAQAHVDLGMTYLRQEQLDTARSEFDLAIAIYPQLDTAYHANALLLSRLGEDQRAMDDFSKAVYLNPDNFAAANDYGIHLCQQNQTKKGIEQLNRIDGVAPEDQALGIQLGLGICHYHGNDFKAAENHLRVVLQQAPTLPQALLPMAEINYRSKAYLSARAFLERYFGAGALSERSLFLAANVESELGDINKANQYRRELKRRFPGSPLNSELESLLSE